MARWLKAHWHRTGLESFPFTDEFLAAQVGVNGQVTGQVLNEFQRNGVITRGHNTITIADQDRLTQRLCSCFKQAKAATDEYVDAVRNLSGQF